MFEITNRTSKKTEEIQLEDVKVLNTSTFSTTQRIKNGERKTNRPFDSAQLKVLVKKTPLEFAGEHSEAFSSLRAIYLVVETKHRAKRIENTKLIFTR